MRSALRDLRFAWRLGLKTAIRCLDDKEVTAAHRPVDMEFLYLSMIGVSSQARGRGIASRLMNPVLELAAVNGLAAYLETANPGNVEIYRHKGFALVAERPHPGWRSAVIRRRPPLASSLGKGARVVLDANLGEVVRSFQSSEVRSAVGCSR